MEKRRRARVACAGAEQAAEPGSVEYSQQRVMAEAEAAEAREEALGYLERQEAIRRAEGQRKTAATEQTKAQAKPVQHRSTGIPAAWLVLALLLRLCALAVWVGLGILVVWMGIAMFTGMEGTGKVYFGPLIACAIALYAVGKGAFALFFGHPALENAVLLDLRQHASLAQLLEEVAAKLGTRPADYALLGMSGSFHVFQGRALLLTGQVINGRILHLSAPLIRILSREELGAVLAHEFAHFTGGDTLYSCHVAPELPRCSSLPLRSARDSGAHGCD